MEYFRTVVVGAFGLVIGSFTNVLIDRLPAGEDVFWGRSHCDHCKKQLRWYELIPVLSYVLLGGRCMRCRKRLSLQYPLIEGITALGLFTAVALHRTEPLTAAAAFLFFLSFLVMLVTDAKTQILPDSMMLLACISALLLLVLRGDFFLTGVSYLAAASGAALFFFVLWGVTRGKGMGFGDVKLAFVMGLFLGFPKIVLALYIAFLTGAITGVILILVGHKTLKTKIAFGPFLIAGTAVAAYWSDIILSFWRTLW